MALQVALLEQLVEEAWTGPYLLVLNPTWSVTGATVPKDYQQLVESFEVVYSFLPISIQVRHCGSYTLTHFDDILSM